MGLDMYLGTNSKKVCKAANKASGTDASYFHYGDAIYWRKANAIHNWFVQNVQYGNDDCGTYEVSVEQLLELRDVCEKVLAASKLISGEVFSGKQHKDGEWVTLRSPGLVIEDNTVAEEVLPTSDGFFFGDTEYDEYYFDEVERTLNGINAILDNVERYESKTEWGYVREGWREKGEKEDWSVSFTYHASW